MNYKGKYLFYFATYFGIMHLVPFLNMFMAGRMIKTFWFVDTVAIYSIILTVIYILKKTKKNIGAMSVLDFWVLIYLILSIFSFFLYFQKGHPASILAYAYGIHHLVFPIFLFFSVKLLSSESQKRLLKIICFLNLFFVMVGFLMHYFSYSFYTSYLLEKFAKKGYKDMWQLYSRLQSYFGSTAVGNISVVTVILTSILDFKLFQKIILFSSMIIAAMLSFQRSAIILTLLAILYYLFVTKTNYKKIVVFTFSLFIIIVLATAFNYKYLSVSDISFTQYLKHKIMDEIILKSSLSERTLGYQRGWNFFSAYPLGLGLGATLSATETGGAHPGGQVVDANFMRILADLGLVGLTIFIIIIIYSVHSALIYKKSFGLVLIVLIYILQAIVTNVFDSYYIVHFFWLLLGIIDTPRGRPSSTFRHNIKNIVNVKSYENISYGKRQ